MYYSVIVLNEKNEESVGYSSWYFIVNVHIVMVVLGH